MNSSKKGQLFPSCQKATSYGRCFLFTNDTYHLFIKYYAIERHLTIRFIFQAAARIFGAVYLVLFLSLIQEHNALPSHQVFELYA